MGAGGQLDWKILVPFQFPVTIAQSLLTITFLTKGFLSLGIFDSSLRNLIW